MFQTSHSHLVLLFQFEMYVFLLSRFIFNSHHIWIHCVREAKCQIVYESDTSRPLKQSLCTCLVHTLLELKYY